MRKSIAVIFLIIFSFQVLPMKLLGKLLAKGQTEEEVKADCDDEAPDGKVGKYGDFLSYASFKFNSAASVKAPLGFAIHRPDDLPVSYAADILCPPPNC